MGKKYDLLQALRLEVAKERRRRIVRTIMGVAVGLLLVLVCIGVTGVCDRV